MISEQLAQYIADTDYEKVPEHTKVMAKLCFLDWLGSAYAGSEKAPALMTRVVVQEQGGSAQATIINSDLKTSSLNAALVNGVASHTVELDDVHKASIYHPGAPVISAALAAAERVGASGKDLLTAIILGYEISIRIGEAVTPSHYQYFHTTGTCATFGAAVAAGKLFGLDVSQLVNALGNAGTQAAGLWECLAEGAMSKSLHPAKAAVNGILAALLAEQGFTGAKGIIEGEKGFVKAMAREYSLAKITDGLGEGYKIDETVFKVYSCCRHTHPSMDVAIELATEYDLRSADISKVIITTNNISMDFVGNKNYSTLYAAKFSLPFCVSLALRYRKGGLDQFTDSALKDLEIGRLTELTELKTDPNYTEAFPEKWSANVEVITKDGQRLKGFTDFPKGDPENQLSAEELEIKFADMVRDFLEPGRISEIIQLYRRLDKLKDVRMLFGQ